MAASQDSNENSDFKNHEDDGGKFVRNGKVNKAATSAGSQQ